MAIQNIIEVIEDGVILVEIIEIGPKGDKGDQGIQGEVGQGLSDGGTINQVLKKLSDDDYDTYWADESGGANANESLRGNNTPDPYNESLGYFTGDYVIYENPITFISREYKALLTINAPSGVFDPSAWQETTVQENERRLFSLETGGIGDTSLEPLRGHTLPYTLHSVGALYTAGDFIEYEDAGEIRNYLCLTDTTGNFDPIAWQELSIQENERILTLLRGGVVRLANEISVRKWEISREYVFNDLVSYLNEIYAVLVPTDTGTAPDSDPLIYELITTTEAIKTTFDNAVLLPDEVITNTQEAVESVNAEIAVRKWKSNINFKVNEIVFYSNKFYKVLIDNINIPPDSDPLTWEDESVATRIGFDNDLVLQESSVPTVQEAIEETNNEIGVRQWIVTNTYLIDESVYFSGSIYRLIITSDLGTQPNSDPLTWANISSGGTGGGVEAEHYGVNFNSSVVLTINGDNTFTVGAVKGQVVSTVFDVAQVVSIPNPMGVNDNGFVVGMAEDPWINPDPLLYKTYAVPSTDIIIVMRLIQVSTGSVIRFSDSDYRSILTLGTIRGLAGVMTLATENHPILGDQSLNVLRYSELRLFGGTVRVSGTDPLQLDALGGLVVDDFIQEEIIIAAQDLGMNVTYPVAGGTDWTFDNNGSVPYKYGSGGSPTGDEYWNTTTELLTSISNNSFTIDTILAIPKDNTQEQLILVKWRSDNTLSEAEFNELFTRYIGDLGPFATEKQSGVYVRALIGYKGSDVIRGIAQRPIGSSGGTGSQILATIPPPLIEEVTQNALANNTAWVFTGILMGGDTTEFEGDNSLEFFFNGERLRKGREVLWVNASTVNLPLYDAVLNEDFLLAKTEP
jgi:hypothetical protein